MILYRRLLTLLSVAVLFLTACQRELKNELPPTPTGDVVTATPVTGSLSGYVMDDLGVPVTGAVVKAGSQSVTTNSRGLFRFDAVTLDKYGSVVKVEKPGYFLALRTFPATNNQAHYVRIKLIKKNQIGTINATTGGSVSLSGSSITLPANAVVVKATNAPYTGTVRVFAANVDPTAGDISLVVPGSFQANDANGIRVLLKSYGMIGVELEGTGGEPLQIASGKKANLKIAIPASLQAAAPATLPFWYLDETSGIWKEEGTGTRNGTYYEGEVSHFSFWNSDIGNNAIYLQMTLQTNEGPLPFTMVKITRVNNGSFSYGHTDSLGHVNGYVFGNEPLLLEVIDNCGISIYSQNIGPFSGNTNLGNITVTLPELNEMNITGSAVNCSNQPVTNGSAFIYFEGTVFVAPVINGNFELHVTRCTSSTALVEVVVEDKTTNQQSAPVTGTANGGNLATGVIHACGTSSVSSINYTIDGNLQYEINSTVANDSLAAYGSGAQNFTNVSAFKLTQPNINISFGFNGASVGTYLLSNLQVNQYDSVVVVSPLNVNVTTYGAAGQFIEGSFNGQFKEGAASTTHTISCTFRVRRF